MTRLFTDLVLEATQILKHADAEKFGPVIRLLLDAEQVRREKPPTQVKRRVDVADRNGDRARGGSRAYIPQALIDAAIKEAEKTMSAEDERALEANKKKAKALFRGRENK